MTKENNIPNPIPPTYKGWFYLKLTGDYRQIGYQHGYNQAYMIWKIIQRMREYTFWSTGVSWETLRDYIEPLWWNRIPPAYQQEMQQIALGVNDRLKPAKPISTADILMWNTYEETVDYLLPTYQDEILGINKVKRGHKDCCGGCSAFVALGKYTKTGSIVMAHNTWVPFEMAYSNLILEIEIPNISHFTMQTSPGLIHSETDFGVNNNGIMITETTIGGFSSYTKNGMPEAVRARQAIETATNFDDFCQIMRDGNTGGYANSWLVGNIQEQEIMRLELGLNYTPDTILKDGYFIGYNAPIDPQIRNLECSNTGYMDTRRHQGARQVRLLQLMEEFKGNITADNGKQIIADHVDTYLSQLRNETVDNPCSRTVDGHYELDPREYMCQPGRPLPFQPRGTIDGKVMDAEMAAKQDFYLRWGSSSDIGFDAEAFFKKYPQFLDLKPYIDSRPAQDWTSVSELRTNLGGAKNKEK